MSHNEVIEMMCNDIISCTEEPPSVDHRARIKIAAERIKLLLPPPRKKLVKTAMTEKTTDV